MKKIFSVALILISTLAFASSSSISSRPSVLLISIDGFRADYLDAQRSPNLWQIAQQGVRAKGLQPIFPSLTFPNHYAIITGLYAEHHGIVANEMIDPKIPDQRFKLGDPKVMDDPRWWQEGEPLWVTAEKQNVRSATMFWPGSSVEIHSKRPTYWKPFDQSVTNDARVDQIIAWLDLPESQRPHFLTLYFDEVDTAGHMAGPLSAEVIQAIAHVDTAIGRLQSLLKARNLDGSMNIVVVSDHGMAKVDQSKVIALNDYLVSTDYKIIGGGAMASLYPSEGKLDAVYAKLKNANPRMQVFRKSEVPERFHYQNNDRIGPIVLLASEGSYITTSLRGVSTGNHGFDNSLADMFGLFVAQGPAFQSGLTIDTFANIHIYPMLSKVLGITPAKVDGDLSIANKILK